MTTRSTPPDDEAPSFGDLELEVLRQVWRLGSGTAEEVRAGLARPLKESTVRTVLRRLEEKRVLCHTLDGRTFRYRAVEEPEQLAARGVRDLADRFFKGSLEALLVGLVDGRALNRDELERLAGRIAAARRKKP